METKFELHPDLQDASLEKACGLADKIVNLSEACPTGFGDDDCPTATLAADLSYMLEYLRLNFDLVPKK
jgi:hypothetical protein